MSNNFDITSPLINVNDDVGNTTDVTAVNNGTPTIKTFADVDGDEGHNDIFIEDIAADGHNNNVTDSENRGDDFDDDLVAGNKDKD